LLFLKSSYTCARIRIALFFNASGRNAGHPRRQLLRELSCYRSSTMTTARWIYVLTTGGPAVNCHQRLGRQAGTVHGQLRVVERSL